MLFSFCSTINCDVYVFFEEHTGKSKQSKPKSSTVSALYYKVSIYSR